MQHIPVTRDQREMMLRTVGVSSVDELFDSVPEEARLCRELELPQAMGEIELTAHLEVLAASNTPQSPVCFAGAGCYDHFVPSVVGHVLSKPEFFTAYTPYQPEVSQGTLQAMYEYQTGICELTGMEVANASMYDGATALVEAAMMACRITKRDRVVCATTVHPQWRETLATYAAAGTFSLAGGAAFDSSTGTAVLEPIPEDVAAVLIQSPNYLGNFEDLAEIGRLAHEAGALLVVASNPILLGAVEPPSAYGADIVVGEGQPLGNAMSFGGPGLGFFACRSEHVRQMPGRVVGRTVDADGARAFVLTLSTREQHIRREKATSNICSNHALNALAAGAYLAAVGADGLAGIAHTCMRRARYLRSGLLGTGRFTEPWDSPFGYEFALTYDGDATVFIDTMLERGFLAGVSVDALEKSARPPLEAAVQPKMILFAVTEKRSAEQIDAFVEAVRSL